jgi:hypothetical protein
MEFNVLSSLLNGMKPGEIVVYHWNGTTPLLLKLFHYHEGDHKTGNDLSAHEIISPNEKTMED